MRTIVHQSAALWQPVSMADLAKRLPANVQGGFFVDSTCINCDTCRQLAPGTFADDGEHSYVFRQPEQDGHIREALQALVACPTGSIGALDKTGLKRAIADFPLELDARVFYCGFNSEKSFGGNSYFIRRPEGNWLVDSPRYTGHLVRRFEEMGGVRYIFLTHRDDVADADKYARRFAGVRIIHRLELSAQPGAERVIDGFEPEELAPGFLAIPTPGHTRGHCALLHADRFLFSGDHLWWSRPRGRLHASRDVCWYSWARQVASVATLLPYSFEWVLPGHGQRVHLERGAMRRELERLVSLLAAA